MRSTLAELMLGFGTALISVLLVTSAIMMSLGEILPAPVVSGSSAQSLSATPGEQIASEATPEATVNPSLVPLTTCATPKSWQTYVIKAGDTVEKLAAAYALTADQIIRYNCLNNPSLQPDAELFLPPLPPPPPTATASPLPPTDTRMPTFTRVPTQTAQPADTATPQPVCRPPAGWKPYRVRSGETLSSIGALYNISYLTILDASCLPRNHKLIAGDILYVPYTFTSTPKATKTNTAEPPTPTSIPATATIQPTNTAQPTPSDTPVTPTEPTSTPVTPTVTLTSVPPTTDTPTPTPTDLVIPTLP